MHYRIIDNEAEVLTMAVIGARKTKSAEIRATLDHPVIDCDGHLREFLPTFEDYVKKHGGADLAARYLPALKQTLRNHVYAPRDERHYRQTQQEGFWTVTTAGAPDFATQLSPRLLNERLQDFGVDYCILYPTLGLILNTNRDAEIRQVSMRALNNMHADLYNNEFGYRINVPAVVPMTTPQEAIDGIKYAVGELGAKVIQVPPGVVRPIQYLADKYPGIELEAPDGVWIDRYGMDSEYDYDPVWQCAVDHKVAITSHGALMPSFPKLNRSTSNFTFNHVRQQPSMMEHLCKAIYMGGVTRRFPTLNFGFMEGGVAWACNLMSDIVGHWEKRNPKALEWVNPANLDKKTAQALLVEWEGERFQGDTEEVIAGIFHMHGDKPPEIDDFAAMKIEKKSDFGELFSRFYFGCEADDRMTAHAFADKVNRFGMKMKALLSSDIGHFDVVHMDEVVEEAFENVEKGVITPEDFRAQVADNAILLHGGMNPDFYTGTAVEDYANKVLRENARQPEIVSAE